MISQSAPMQYLLNSKSKYMVQFLPKHTVAWPLYLLFFPVYMHWTAARLRSNDFDFRANIAYPLSSVLRKQFHAERAEKLQYQKYCRQAEEKLQRLLGR